MMHRGNTRNETSPPQCCPCCRKALVLTILNSVVILTAIVSAVIYHIVILPSATQNEQLSAPQHNLSDSTTHQTSPQLGKSSQGKNAIAENVRQPTQKESESYYDKHSSDSPRGKSCLNKF